ncbi:hypothetical protein C2S51_011987 [Perilla frutescens var. frutescens]|nr:hypothetical protein C2S51_011987 [Perilla frutescens var. frutescens]
MKHEILIRGQQQVPCMFFFGDSLLENGNNNNLLTLAKTNYPPYGIDYPGGLATGRSTNGLNLADFLAQLLGFANPIPPFVTATGSDILRGVNYASAGAGILDETGANLGERISLNQQLRNHEATIGRVVSLLGNQTAADGYLGQCLYVVCIGSDDYVNNYYFPLSPSRVLYTPVGFAEKLIRMFSQQLRDLYSYGARKVAVFGLGTIGCVPAALRGAMYGPQCLTATKATSGVFNDKLKSLVDVLNKDLVGAKFTFIDTFGITVSDPSSNGFQVPNLPCCMMSMGGMCVPLGVSCSDRANFAYFDGFHPTEAAAMIVAKRAFKAQSPSDAYPSDIQHLSKA